MIYLLLDDLLGAEELDRLKQQLGDKGLQDLNVTSLDGQKNSLDELIRACGAMPFLAERRLVIVRRMLARLEPRNPSADPSRKSGRAELAKALADYLPNVPPTTDVVFVEESRPPAGNPVFKAIQSVGGRIAESKALKDDALVDWIEKRAKRKGGRIARGAADELAAYVGSNLRLLDKEIEKLVIYAGAAEVTSQDVRAMVSYAREASIFGLLDTIGQQDSRAALRKLRELLDDGGAPAYLLVMITRQIRLMLLAKELAAAGRSREEIGVELRLQQFPRDKILQQIRRFSLAQLEQAYRRLLAADSGIKSGQTTPLVALDLLVVELASGA
ncbi:MAG: DNA polymerase III subunit delta [Chloroflexi bacterium]|nr:DNA polymerase III subunit delta [Chloroflexota bacterium]